VSLLVDERHQQPLYGSMCALIPTGCAHRSTVVGGPITYQSLYFFANPSGVPQTVSNSGWRDPHPALDWATVAHPELRG
jgi:hypothetical protein